MNREDIIRMAQEAGLSTVYAVVEQHSDGTETVIDHRPFLERFAGLVATAEAEDWELKCQQYINIHDAVVKDNERLYALLDRCETEMRYAGWATLETDNFGRHDTYHAVLKYLHPEDFE